MKKYEGINWGKIRLSDIFHEISRGKISDLRNIENGNTMIIAASGINEGFSCFANNDPITKDAMTISFNGVGTGTAFVHNYPFNLNSDCGLVTTKEKISTEALRFIAVSINQNKEKFNYGYKANESRILRQTILLPIDKDGKPDYQFMEQYIKEIEINKRKEYSKYCTETLEKLGGGQAYKQIPCFNEIRWSSFKLVDLFSYKRGNQNKMNSLIEGNELLISAKNINNGLKGFVTKNDKCVFEKHTITLNNDGDGGVGLAFYQPFEYLLDSHCTCLKSKHKINKYISLFMSASISKQRELFSHGRSISEDRLKLLQLMLPIQEDGNIDYQYMEQFVKNEMIKKYQSYLNYIRA